MKLRPLLAATLFALTAVPTLVRSQSTFDLTSAPIATDDITADFTFSLADLGPIQSDGGANYPGVGQVNWTAGTPAADVFTVGMLDEFGFKNLSLDQISNTTGQNLSTAALSSFPLVQSLTVSQLSDSIPGLAETPINDVAPFSALAQQQGVSLLNGTVGQIAPLIRGPLSQLGGQVANFEVSQIPGLSNVSLGQLPGIDTAKISDIPGLSQFPLFNPLSIKDWFVPFDMGFGMSECSLGHDCHERNIDKTASGNLKDMQISCMGEKQSCAHIEVKRKPENIRWISKEQKVSGGSGLGAGICNKEPTGRFPLGPNPKVVLEKINEKEGKIELALYFSVHVEFDHSDSAHCVGPFPLPFFGTAKEGDWILFGPDTVPKHSPFSSIGQQSGPNGGPGIPGGGDYGGACLATDGKTSATYKGVDVAAFKQAISVVESLGSGGYSAIGTYVNNDGAGNHGRALGKYQFMSYGPARAIVLQKPGGQEFLNQIDSPSINLGQLQALTEKYFTSAEQETLMDSQIRHLADLAASKGLSGDKMIFAMAAMHTGGDGASINVDPDYSDRVVAGYNKGGCVAGSGTSTGKLRYPVDPSIPITSPYGWRVHPVTGESAFHGGVDFGASYGTPIHAADGGIVRFAGWDDLCGNMTIIDHANGLSTTYCHASVLKTTTGMSVSAGQVIALVGSTGRSTGPHLHFGVKKNGQLVDPMIYLGR